MMTHHNCVEVYHIYVALKAFTYFHNDGLCIHFVHALKNAVTIDQLNPVDAAVHLADLTEADSTELINPIPPGLF